MIFTIIPLIVSCLFLGAHFLRSANSIISVLCLLMPFLLLIKKRWILYIIQIFTYIGGGIWLNTTIFLIRKRLTMGLPWHKPAIILGAIAVFTVFSGLLLNLKVVKEKYPTNAHKK